MLRPVYSLLFAGFTLVAGAYACSASSESANPYPAALEKALAVWPPKTRQNPDFGAPPAARLRCYRTPGNDFYIGLGQWLSIHAPLSAVAAVLDDFEHYSDLFPDLEKVKVLSREGNRVETFWEDHIPFFFIPNVKYRMAYRIDGAADRKVYRYQLIDGDKLKQSDGFIAIESAPSGGTYYTELDFVDADWGILKTLAPGRIWKDSVEGLLLSDAAIALKAEHPDWAYERVRKESRNFLQPDIVEPCLKDKREFSLTDFMK